MPRFYTPPPSRLVVSKWDPTSPQAMPLLTFLDGRATNRRSHHELGAPASFTAEVPADDPEINIRHDDNFALSGHFYDSDYPFLAEGVRLLHMLRREEPAEGDPYVCRFAGPILGTEDHSDPDRPTTTFTAYDPWAFLFARPCVRCVRDPASAPGAPVCLIDGGTGRPEPQLVPTGPIIFPAGTRLNHIIGALLQRTIDAHGPVAIDAGDGSSGSGDGNDYAGTAEWGGTIEDCATIDETFVIQRGTSVGEAWQQLMETGLCKIILRPIYDPDVRPGYCAELNIFRTDSAYDGLFEEQSAASGGFLPVMAWDRSGHDMIDITRAVDGTERANKIAFYGPNDVPLGTVTSAGSVTRFGQYWTEQQFIRISRSAPLSATAQQEQFRREPGRRVWQFAPTPEFTYRPWQDYDIGWLLDFYHSNRLREEQPPFAFGFFQEGRVLGFDVAYPDHGGETVTGLLLSPEDVDSVVAP